MGLDMSGIGEAATSVQKILGMFFPDKTQEEKDKLAGIIGLITQQNDINKAEAAQPGVHFRDGAGWVCVAGFALMLFRPVLEWICILLGHKVDLPVVDTTVSGEMLAALLGLGGMHMYEQVNK